MNIHESTRLYEDWLRQQLKGDVIKPDLDRKRVKMKESPFAFLRATYWRWAETILDVCPDLAGAAPVLAIGDVHLENYGTWRDVDGRLVWGVNDFDEASRMPYALDLVRLAASAVLGSNGNGAPAEEICSAILEGYGRGLRAPHPIVLDRDHRWLRELVVVSEKQRAKFWEKIAAARQKPVAARYRKALTAAMPQSGLALKIAPRSAGSGSLGRPRWMGVADWRGAPIVREAKALASSAWMRGRGRGTHKIRVGEIAAGRFRPLDPWFQINGHITVRRLSPNNRKIEVEDAVEPLLMPDMLGIMGFEVANVHVGATDCRAEISRDLKRRKSGWLAMSANKAVEAITRDYADWRS